MFLGKAKGQFPYEDIEFMINTLISFFSFSLMQNITIQRDKLGVTPVHFLATKDIDRVRQIALIELTAVFDRLNLTYTSHRKSSKKRFKGMKVCIFMMKLPCVLLMKKNVSVCLRTLKNSNISVIINLVDIFLP